MAQIALIVKITLALVNILGFLLSFWVYGAGKKNKLHQWFVLMTFSVVLWVDFAFLGNTVEKRELSIMFYRLNWLMVILFLVSSFYFYVVYFLKISALVLRRIILAIGLMFAPLSLFSPLIIGDVVSQPWGNEIIFGWLNNFFNAYALAVAILIVGFLLKKYSGFDKTERLRTQYLVIGTFLFVSANIIFNIIIPSMKGTAAYQYFGDHSAIILLGFTAYAIVKKELFRIKIILTQVLAVSMCAILLVLSFVIDILWIKTLLVIVFLMSCVFGYFLIKSAKTELQQKEILRELVQERTAELQKAFDELKSRKDELEKFYNLTIGRELKMAELKERIKKLSEEANY